MRDQEWLESALHALDLVYFDGALAEDGVKVKWHTFRPGKDTLVYGDYFGGQIRMSRVLSQMWVPSYMTVGTLFHETLHHVIGMDHDLTFSLAESQYVHHAKAAVWERLNFDALMAAAQKRTKK